MTKNEWIAQAIKAGNEAEKLIEAWDQKLYRDTQESLRLIMEVANVRSIRATAYAYGRSGEATQRDSPAAREP